MSDKRTDDELANLIAPNGEGYGAESWYSWPAYYRREDGRQIDGVGLVKVVDYFDTDEYSGRMYMIFEITDADGAVTLYQKNGRYISHEGTEWDGDFFEVRPSTRTIVTYNRVF